MGYFRQMYSTLCLQKWYFQWNEVTETTFKPIEENLICECEWHIHNLLLAPVPNTFVDSLNLRYGLIGHTWLAVAFLAFKTFQYSL